MNLIFVCKYNRFRSRIAEAYFKKINKNKNLHATSSGVFKGLPVAENVIKIGKEWRINTGGQTRGLHESEFVDADLIVVTANDVPVSLFKRFKGKVIRWKIPDISQSNKKRIEEIMKEIFKKVDVLVRQLRKTK